MRVQDLLDRLEGVRPRGAGKWSARCPAHQDNGPSLSIAERMDRILVHCFAGCTPEAIITALGLGLRDLFMDAPLSQRQRATLLPQTLDLTAIAFQFDLAALDRRLRAEQVLTAVAAFTGEGIEDSQRNRLVKAVVRAYRDRERAELFEGVADALRVMAYEERIARHAA